MKKIFSLALGALMSISAWSFDNVPATFAWAVGNESAATVTSDAADGVSQTKVAVGVGLVVTTSNSIGCNSGNMMVLYNPATSKPGAVADAMIEYSVKMKKGVTFTMTGLSYDAVKKGTDNASYKWSYEVDGVASDTVEVDKDHLLRDNKTAPPALNHSEEITANAGQVVKVRFFVSGFDNGKNFCLSNIKLMGTVNGEEEVRTFTNFKIDFRSEEPTVVEPEGGVLPSNVSFSNLNYKDAQHGLQGGTITVNVDGPIKFTLGGCGYGNNIAVQKNGVDLIAIDNKVGCDNSGVGAGYTKFVTWTYNEEEAAVLTFTVNGFLPYMFAEACEYVPQVEVRYFDVDGKTLIGEPQIVEGGSALAYAYGASDVTVEQGKAFRGWFNGSVPTATKVKEGTPLTENLSLYARATDIEVAALGKIYDYDFRQAYFYPEDHEVLTFAGNASYKDNQHGWTFGNGSTLSIEVAGNALLSVGVCKYSNTGATLVKDADGNTVGQLDVVKETTPDGEEQVIRYTGAATTLTFEFTTTNYIHRLKVYNIAEFPEKNELGYFEVASGDAAGFLLALTAAEAGDKIFLPNGLYDMGEAVLTPISKNNISIIGESMEGTIIKNAPDFHKEGIGTTATFLITATGTYFQDLTIQNAMDYYAAIAAGLEGGRGVVLQDKGTQTVCKNVKLLSFQDTYYSNGGTGSVYYFEDCEIHGTVDFICGEGNAYFKNNLLYCEKRNLNGSGTDALTANKSQAEDFGYAFEGCTVKSECPVVSLGRAWDNTPQVTFINTLVDYSAGQFSFEGDNGKIQRWTKQLMSVGAWPIFGEYNTHLADGTVLTPSSNEVTFIDKSPSTETQIKETILSEGQVNVRTIANTLGEWGATAVADATQAVCEPTAEEFEPNGIYLVEANGEFQAIIRGSEFMDRFALNDGVTYTVRKANARGGFGWKAGEEPQGISNTAAEAVKVQKIIRNGQVIILRDNKAYNIIGAELR